METERGSRQKRDVERWSHRESREKKDDVGEKEERFGGKRKELRDGEQRKE